jgi:hypothetical protein
MIIFGIECGSNYNLKTAIAISVSWAANHSLGNGLSLEAW